jgi:hypothetical protein
MPRTEKFKLPKVWEQVLDDENRIGNVEIIDVRNEDVAFNKRHRKIILIKDHLVVEEFASESLIVNYEFEKLPEWAIPFLHVHTILHTESGFEVNEYLSWGINYLWKQVGESYFLKYTLRGKLLNVLNEVPLTLIEAPLYADVEIHVLNKFVWHEVQQSKA